MGWRDFREQRLMQQKRNFKNYEKIIFSDILYQMQFGIFFIRFFYLEFLKNNFCVSLLQKVLFLKNNFVYFYNFYCLCEEETILIKDHLDNQDFRFVEVTKMMRFIK
jgi:hypothetical protein